LWLAFFRGQLTLMVVVGVTTWLGLAALGVSGAPYLAATAGLLEIVPSLGPIIATVAAATVALLKGSTYLQISHVLLAGLVVLFYVLVQQLENLFIVPRVMGDALKLPALVVLAGIAAGAALGGVPGAVLATPVIATGRELLRYGYHKRRGEEPFPAEKAAPRQELSAPRHRQ
jgi:predicted PurR-regulated permease PerM